MKNRVIKFRAWITEETKWVGATEIGMFTGFSFSNIKAGHSEANTICDDGSVIEEPEWDKIVIMQFTGLKDKNGVEICEGDILRKHDTWYPEVNDDELFEVSFMVEIPWTGFICFELGNRKSWVRLGGVLDDDEQFEVEVIGNIYENPELLKKD